MVYLRVVFKFALNTHTTKMSPINSKYDFSGKVALVTGSSSGIGAAIAIQFAQYGARVVITGRNEPNLAKIAHQIKQVSDGVKPLQIIGDLQDDSFARKLIQQTIDKYGGLNFLVNNAGGGTPVGNLTSANLLEELDQVFKLNVRSVVQLTQLAVPHLEKTQGNVINISSIAAIVSFMLIYSASKAALDMVTKTSALELGPKGIRVNSINPGPVVTAFGRSLGIDDPAAFEKMMDNWISDTLMKRVGRPEDIANLASFLASDDARNITGAIYVSDSGMLIKPSHVNANEMEKQLKETAK